MLKAKVCSFQKQNLIPNLCIVEMLFKLSQRATESEVTGVQAKNAMSLQCLKLWERKKSPGTAVACSGRSTEL